jgi:hypothetical protein
MRIWEIEVKRRVWVGLALGAIATVAWWSWTRARLPIMGKEAAKTAHPLVRLAGAGTVTGDEVLREKAELMDPTPLFFPTQWNYGQRPLREGRLNQLGQVFGSFEPKLTVGEQNIANYGAEAAPVPEKLVDVLVQGNEAPFAGIGQIDAPRSTLAVRAGYLEVRDQKNGNIVISQQLSGIAPPRSDFAPVEFLVVVGSAGLIGEPILTSDSVWDEVEIFFRAYLVKSYRLGERLRPGQYRVSVGA